MLLLKAVISVDAHLAPHGATQRRYEEALALFVSSSSSGGLQNVCAPTWKTLNDRFKKVVSDHRLAVRNNAVASGIIEVRGEREDLLDDIVLAMDEWEEKRRSERDARTELDKRLMEAGKEIRSMAVARNVRDASDKSPSEARKGRKRRAAVVESDDEEEDMIGEHIAARNEMEQKRIKLEEDRLNFEKSRDEREAARADRALEHEARRLKLDEKRMELEVARVAMEKEERTGMVSVLSALVKKLQ